MNSKRSSPRELGSRQIKRLNALAQKVDVAEIASIRKRGRLVFARHEQLRAVVAALTTIIFADTSSTVPVTWYFFAASAKFGVHASAMASAAAINMV